MTVLSQLALHRARSPCPKKPPPKADEKRSCDAPLSSRDPWGREAMRTPAASAAFDRSRPPPMSHAGTYAGGGGGSESGAEVGELSRRERAKEPAWKKWRARHEGKPP